MENIRTKTNLHVHTHKYLFYAGIEPTTFRCGGNVPTTKPNKLILKPEGVATLEVSTKTINNIYITARP